MKTKRKKKRKKFHINRELRKSMIFVQHITKTVEI